MRNQVRPTGEQYLALTVSADLGWSFMAGPSPVRREWLAKRPTVLASRLASAGRDSQLLQEFTRWNP
jgi:hypothetical protein